jgi:predicted NBD/HSP70 family sugar kinase
MGSFRLESNARAMEKHDEHSHEYEHLSPDELRKRADEGDEGAREYSKKRDREDGRASD